MVFELRSYQQDLVSRTLSSLANKQTPLIVLPTGGGKTVIIAELVRLLVEQQRQVLLTAHRIEIVHQIAASIAKHTSITPGLAISGSTIDWNQHRVIVGMVPTLIRRLDSLPKGWALIEDEAHHATAKSWAKLREAITPPLRVGLTATPITPSGGGLGSAGFTDLLEGPNPKQLIEMGSLVPPRYLAAPPAQTIDATGCKVVRGDFDLTSLEENLDGVKLAADALALYRQHAPDTQAIVAAMSCRHAQLVADQFNRAGVPAAYVDGSMPMAQRTSAMKRFASGEVQALCQVAVIDEGTDIPAAEALLLLRPTRSIRLHRQLIGRVLRPAPGKTRATVIDAANAYADCGLPTDHIRWSLEGLEPGPPRPTQRLESGEIQEHPEAELILRQQIRLQEITAQEAAKAKFEKGKENLRTVVSMYRHNKLPRSAVHAALGKQPRSLDEFELAGHALRKSSLWAEQQWDDQNTKLIKQGQEPAPEHWPEDRPTLSAPLVGRHAPLSEIWAAALQVCDLPSTCLVMKAQAQLSSLGDSYAVVVANPGWEFILQNKSAAISGYLSQATGRQVQARIVRT